MEYRYKPVGVCSSEMIIETEGDIIKKVKIVNGCAGNTAGVSRLAEGRKIDEVIELLKGIPCGTKRNFLPRPTCESFRRDKRKKRLGAFCFYPFYSIIYTKKSHINSNKYNNLKYHKA